MSKPRTWFHILHFCPIVRSHVLVLVYTRPSINKKTAADSVYDLEFIILKTINETGKCFIRTPPQTTSSSPGSFLFPSRSCEGKKGLPGNKVGKTFANATKIIVLQNNNKNKTQRLLTVYIQSDPPINSLIKLRGIPLTQTMFFVPSRTPKTNASLSLRFCLCLYPY